ncbi:MAG: potassium channel family protein [Pirellulales bacterium]
MFSVLAIASLLVALTVILHTYGLGFLLRRLMTSGPLPTTRLAPIVQRLIHITWVLLLIHGLEIGVWGVFFHGLHCFPDWETSLYFSAVTYTTLGYGDVVLPTPWRLLGPIEGLTGILMSGLSVGVFAAHVGRVTGVRLDPPAG